MSEVDFRKEAEEIVTHLEVNNWLRLRHENYDPGRAVEWLEERLRLIATNYGLPEALRHTQAVLFDEGELDGPHLV